MINQRVKFKFHGSIEEGIILDSVLAPIKSEGEDFGKICTHYLISELQHRDILVLVLPENIDSIVKGDVSGFPLLSNSRREFLNIKTSHV